MLNPAIHIHDGPLPHADDKSPRCIVYVATNLHPPGNLYVGMTGKGLPARKAQHLRNAKRGQKGHFYNALRKHGVDSFVWHIVEEWPDYFSALEAERKCIRILAPAYNLTSGGGGVKGLRHTSASKAKMSAAKIGRPGVWTNTPMPQIMRDRLALARRAERGVSKPGVMKPLLHIQTGVSYPSVTAAASAFGINIGSMSGRIKRGLGVTFAWVKNDQ